MRTSPMPAFRSRPPTACAGASIRDVPDGTDLVILQPGSNDKRFLWALPARAGNIDAMVKRLRNEDQGDRVRSGFSWSLYQWDFIHFNNEGHAWIAATLLPQVMVAIKPARAPAGGKSVPGSQRKTSASDRVASLSASQFLGGPRGVGTSPRGVVGMSRRFAALLCPPYVVRDAALSLAVDRNTSGRAAAGPCGSASA